MRDIRKMAMQDLGATRMQPKEQLLGKEPHN